LRLSRDVASWSHLCFESRLIRSAAVELTV
jgi:hypothetical protein